MLDRPLVLPAEVLARVVRREALGELHVTLAPVPSWIPVAEERARDAEALVELGKLGLVDRRERVDADLVATVALLCRARVEFSGWVTSGEKTVGVLAAASGRDAVLAVRQHNTVHLRQISPDRLPDSVVEQLPDLPPGRGRAVTVGPPEPSERHYTTKARKDPELALAQRIAELPTTGGGQLSVAARDHANRRTAAPHPLRYADSTRGRWLNLVLPGDRLIIAPAAKADLATRLRDMRKALA
ncbi:ESX secretion-associated protein EspG [Actinokineospora cianjurensis]|uniref:ESAT-6 protein secretion system EspG family protein n=1 Tax=Actinokineospora cianjurensis TaxID=585224 RepID=A0A421B5U2_9PSEU|nr:ESX secretion-associated protein EspG [Actinokineospora cianjurensis]RLK59791.1 ESAT-6 protein secretion system EspG family protein [Actinokineospora cianjurensis]